MHSTNLLWFTIKFFFFSRIITMNSFGCKGPNSKSFRDFFFWWCNFRNHGVWSRITPSKDFFSPKTLQICKDTYHFDNNHESNLKPYWNREMIKECVNIIAIKTFINLVFSSKEFHFFYRRTTRKTYFYKVLYSRKTSYRLRKDDADIT